MMRAGWRQIGCGQPVLDSHFPVPAISNSACGATETAAETAHPASANQFNVDIQIEPCPRSIRGDDTELLTDRQRNTRAVAER